MSDKQILLLELNKMQSRLNAIGAFIKDTRATINDKGMESFLELVSDDLFAFERLLCQVLDIPESDESKKAWLAANIKA